jgi:hypothetical protein
MHEKLILQYLDAYATKRNGTATPSIHKRAYI